VPRLRSAHRDRNGPGRGGVDHRTTAPGRDDLPVARNGLSPVRLVFITQAPPEAGSQEYAATPGGVVGRWKVGSGPPSKRLERSRRIGQSPCQPRPRGTSCRRAVAVSFAPAFAELTRQAAQRTTCCPGITPRSGSWSGRVSEAGPRPGRVLKRKAVPPSRARDRSLRAWSLGEAVPCHDKSAWRLLVKSI